MAVFLFRSLQRTLRPLAVTRGRAGTPFDHLYEETTFASIPREGLNRRVIDRYTRRVVEVVPRRMNGLPGRFFCQTRPKVCATISRRRR